MRLCEGTKDRANVSAGLSDDTTDGAVVSVEISEGID